MTSNSITKPIKKAKDNTKDFGFLLSINACRQSCQYTGTPANRRNKTIKSES